MASLRHRVSHVRGSGNGEREPLIPQNSDGQTAIDYSRLVKHDRLLDAISHRAAENVDGTREEETNLLKNLWRDSFTTSHEAFAKVSKKWTDIGFQRADPLSDFRGGGILSLRHLAGFVAEYGASLSQEADFPLAIASINVSAMLTTHFRLRDVKLAFLRNSSQRQCSAQALAGFLSLGSKCQLAAVRDTQELDGAELSHVVWRAECALQSMHDAMLQHLARRWRERCHADPSTTLLDFPHVLQESYAHFVGIIKASGAAPWNLDNIVAELEQVPPKPSRGWNVAMEACECVQPAAYVLHAVISMLGGFCGYGRSSHVKEH